MSDRSRAILLVLHPARDDILGLARKVVTRLNEAGFEVRINAKQAAQLATVGLADPEDLGDVAIIDGPDGVVGTEVALVLGGDGTFLRAAEDARAAGVPLLGVNLGHVGFLAETEVDALEATVAAIVECRYEVEQRLTLGITVTLDNEVIAEDWALNEAAVEKSSREKMLEVSVSVDDRPLLRFGCDGVICATPTGSTAYAFSVGGPLILPTSLNITLVPIAPHLSFPNAFVFDPDQRIMLDVQDEPARLSIDGQVEHDVKSGDRVEVGRSKTVARLVRTAHARPFLSLLRQKILKEPEK